MIASGLIFSVLMVFGALLLTLSSLWQLRLLREAGILGHRGAFDVHRYDADQARMREMQARPDWKRMRLMLFAGALCVFAAAAIMAPTVFR